MQRVLPGARVVFDVGANVGEWTKLALQINSDATYHCFEPSPTTYRTLCANNWPANVILNNSGLAEERSERRLFIFEDNCGANSLYNRIGTDAKAQKTETFGEAG
jgi:FkbM family methyltransferase